MPRRRGRRRDLGRLQGLPVPAVTFVCLRPRGSWSDSWMTSSACRPLPRLVAQVALGGVAGWATGVPVLGRSRHALLFPVVVNAINFMDGINGITGMVTLRLGRDGDRSRGAVRRTGAQPDRALTAGAALGFLPFNALTARLFLGDVGSYLFGALCAAGILIGLAENVPVVPLVAPLALYLVDVFLTLGRRLRARESLDHGPPGSHLPAPHLWRPRAHPGRRDHVRPLRCSSTACWVFLPAAGAVYARLLRRRVLRPAPLGPSKRLPQNLPRRVHVMPSFVLE